MKILGLDVGTKRIGVAKADTEVKIATPDTTISVDGNELREIARLARLYDTHFFVVGLPRNNQGVETEQSVYSRNFANTLKQAIPEAVIRFQDESLTSVEAEERLKRRKKRYAKGEIDAEAAAIILQDFIESVTNPEQIESEVGAPPIPASTTIPEGWEIDAQAHQSPPEPPEAPSNNQPVIVPEKGEKPVKMAKKHAKLPLIGGGIAVLVVFCLLGAFLWYRGALKPVVAQNCEGETTGDCQIINLTVEEGDTSGAIAKVLEENGLVRSALAFQLYARTHGMAESFKTGTYYLQRSLSVPELAETLMNGPKEEVFTLMLKPGETLMDLKAMLLEEGYSETEIDNALSKTYDLPLLKDKPAGVSLEGYLYGDTYEFYKGESVENIVRTLLEQMSAVIAENNLETAWARQELSVHEALTLASIVQKESLNNAEDYAKVAQVFLTRLHQGLKLGSDVTTQYALDLIDPERQIYSDNAAALTVDSPYNTRKYAGLPPGAISSPSLKAMQAVGNPADSSYLYFLTGDDGVMYYSYTESEHNQNAALHCQELCNISL